MSDHTPLDIPNEKQPEFRVWLPSRRIILKLYVYQGSHAMKTYWPSEPTRCGLTFSYCINTITAPQISHPHIHVHTQTHAYFKFFLYAVHSTGTLHTLMWTPLKTHGLESLHLHLTDCPDPRTRDEQALQLLWPHADGAVYSAGLLNTVRGVLVTALLRFPPRERNDLKSENESLKPTGQNQSHSPQWKAKTSPEVSGEELETTLGLLP